MIGNDLEKLQQPDTALYTQFINESGGTVDDLIVYRRKEDYLLVVNASNIDKDWQWINRFVSNFSDVELLDQSAQTGLLALQGPKAAAVMEKLAGNTAAVFARISLRPSHRQMVSPLALVALVIQAKMALKFL